MAGKEKKVVYVVDDGLVKLYTIEGYMRKIYPDADVRTYACPSTFLDEIYGNLDIVKASQEECLLVTDMRMPFKEGMPNERNCGIQILNRLALNGVYMDAIICTFDEQGCMPNEDDKRHLKAYGNNYLGLVQYYYSQEQEDEFRKLLGMEESKEEGKKGKKKIIIADDNVYKLKAICEYMRAMFPGSEIQTYSCIGGLLYKMYKDKEEIKGKEDDYLLVCDMQMPLYDDEIKIERDAGLQVLQGLKRRKVFVDTILCSSEAIGSEMERELKEYRTYLGFVEYNPSYYQTDAFKKLLGM